MQCKGRVETQGNARARGAHASGPTLTLKHWQTKEGAPEMANTSGQRCLWEHGNTAELSSDCQLRNKMAMNSLLGHRKMTKKKSCTRPPQHVGTCSVQLALEKEQRKRLRGDSEAQDARRQSFTLLAGFPVCRRRVPPAFTSHKMKVEPSFVVVKFGPWSSTRWSQGRRWWTRA